MEFQAELTHALSRVPGDLSRLSELIDPAWIEQTLGAMTQGELTLAAELQAPDPSLTDL